MAFYLHVDDGLIISAAPDPIAETSDALCLAAESLEAGGFIVDDRRVAHQVDKVIGYSPFASPALPRVPADKLARLHLSFEAVLAGD